MTKSLLRLSSSEPLGLQRNSPKNISDPTKSSLSLALYHSLSVFQSLCTLFTQSSRVYTLCSPSLPKSMHSVHPVFYVSMLEPAISNTFPKRMQLVSAPVIIDREPEYEISQIVDSKINHQQACKLLYKVIWLGYENTGDESEWIPTSTLTYPTDLVSDFHIAYPCQDCWRWT